MRGITQKNKLKKTKKNVKNRLMKKSDQIIYQIMVEEASCKNKS